MTARSPRSGFTVLEVLIALTILCAVFGSVLLVQKTAVDCGIL